MWKTLNSNKNLIVLVGAILILFGFWNVGTPDNFDNSPITSGPYKIAWVIDGDTVILNMDGKRETIRLIGIDTPEIDHENGTAECLGGEALEKAKEILVGKSVYLERDQSQSFRDKYDRLLGYIILENGTNFNQMMLEEGYGHEFTYDSIPYKYQKEFKQAELQARQEKRGLWGDGVCE